MTRRSPSILDWYVIQRVLNPFAQGIAMFLGLLLALDVSRRALDYYERGGSALETLQIFLLATPQYLVLSLPMAMLFAGIFTFGQLSADLELTAICAAGRPFKRLMVPVLVFAGAVSVFSFYVSEVIAPWCNRRVGEMESRVAPGGDSHGMSNRIWRDLDEQDRVQMIVFAAEFDPTAPSLRDVTVLRFERDEQGTVREIYLTLAERATYSGDYRWKLDNATTTETLSPRPIVSSQSDIELYRPPSQIVRGAIQARTMTIGMMRDEMASLRELARTDADARKVLLTDATELALRFAVPVACVIFAMAGCPMGVRPERTSRGMSYGLSFGIILLYYILLNYMTRLGNSGAVPAWVAAWFANVVLGIVGAILILRTPQ